MFYNKRVLLTQLGLVIIFLLGWEYAARFNLINSFITSSPSEIVLCIKNLYLNGTLFTHMWVTFYETLIAFFVVFVISMAVSLIMYRFKFFANVMLPFLTMFNSLPKVALGPIIIIWIGANNRSVIFMGIVICVIVSIQNFYTGFISTSQNKIKLMKSFKLVNLIL